MEQLSGGEALIRALHDEGVEFLFGYPGGAVLHIYDALFQQDKVEHILVRHEQAATHAADGYARATGKPGVVLVTSGPGATNAITGIATLGGRGDGLGIGRQPSGIDQPVDGQISIPGNKPGRPGQMQRLLCQLQGALAVDGPEQANSQKNQRQQHSAISMQSSGVM